MKLFDTIERRYLFSLTRGLAMIFIALLVVAIVGGAISVGTQFKGETTTVSPKEVVDAIRPTPAPAGGTTDSSAPAEAKSDQMSLLGVKLSSSLKFNFIGDKNMEVLEGWLAPLTREMRQEFVDEMEAAIAEAEKNKLSATDAINKFKEIKLQKVRDAKLAAAVQDQRRFYYVAAAFSAVLLVALLSLILVLLAIERNTRADLSPIAAK